MRRVAPPVGPAGQLADVDDVADVAVVIVAAGRGSRVGAEVSKVFLPLEGIPLVAWPVRTALGLPGVRRVVVVHPPGEEGAMAAALQPHLGQREVLLVPGGDTRHDSEWHALQALAAEIEHGDLAVVAVHDAARPLATADLFARVVLAAREHGGALPVVPLDQVLGRADLRVPAQRLAGVQTPQAFRAGPLLAAYRAAGRDGFTGTDTASCLERYTDRRDLTIAAVPSSPVNVKVTFPEDLDLVAALSTGRETAVEEGTHPRWSRRAPSGPVTRPRE